MSRNFAESFRVLADFIEANPIDGREYPEQPLMVLIGMATAEGVTEYAARFAAPVRQSVSESGSTHTTAELKFGPDNAVELRIYHIQDPE